MKLLMLRLALSMAFLVSNEGAVVNWSGQVVDIRTGKPIQDARVYGGGQGRVDLTPAGTTDSQGNFTVAYAFSLDLDIWKYYRLEVSYPPDPNLYWVHISAHASPTSFVVRMVPRDAYIRGVLRDQTTAQPIANGTISIGRPGRYIEKVATDAQGLFQFRARAYDTSSNVNWEEGIAPENQAPHETSEPLAAIADYWLEASADGYQKFDTQTIGLAIPLTSSVSPTLHSYVVLEIAPTDSNLTPKGTVEVVEPFAFENWLARHFTPAEIADALISGHTADPDGDGLDNQNEFEASTLPKARDTDGDTLPDGWEILHQLNPLADDAAADGDGDGFSNQLEFLFQTDPRSNASMPDPNLNIRKAVRIDFDTKSGVNYQLQIGGSVNGPWQNSGEIIPGDNLLHSLFFDREIPQQYYRVIPSVP